MWGLKTLRCPNINRGVVWAQINLNSQSYCENNGPYVFDVINVTCNTG